MQEVIIYRNPLEAMLWQNPEYFLYGIGIGIVVMGTYILATKIKDKFSNQRRW